MEEFTPRFCCKTEKTDLQEVSLNLREEINLGKKIYRHKRKHHRHRKSYSDKPHSKSNSKYIPKENLISVNINNFLNEEFDPEKDYEQFHFKRFLLPKIKVFNGQNLENEELLE